MVVGCVLRTDTMAAGATTSEMASGKEFSMLSPNPALISNLVVIGGCDMSVESRDAFSRFG